MISAYVLVLLAVLDFWEELRCVGCYAYVNAKKGQLDSVFGTGNIQGVKWV